MICVYCVMFNTRIGNDVFTKQGSINGSVTICVYRVMFDKQIGNDICLTCHVQKTYR
jgi:hypothetical protein